MKQFTLTVILSALLINLTAQKTLLNTPYVVNADKQQQFDLYLPDDKNFSTILYVHEGSLLGGDKDDLPYTGIAQKFQRHGIAFAKMNYRLGPENKWPSQPDDIVSAFSWLKDSLGKYGGNVNKVFIFGHSSGALLAALVGTDETYLAKKGLNLSDIAGVIAAGTLLIDQMDTSTNEKSKTAFKRDSYLKIFGNAVVFNNASPMIHINSNMPRFLLLIAEGEQFQPPILEQSIEFVKKARQLNVAADYKVIPGRKHMTNITQMINDNDLVFDTVMDFIHN